MQAPSIYPVTAGLLFDDYERTGPPGHCENEVKGIKERLRKRFRGNPEHVEHDEKGKENEDQVK